MQQAYSENSKLILKALAKVIADRRKTIDKSQRLLAYEYGMQSSLISRIESATNDPKFLSVWAISEALGLKMSELLMLIENELPKDCNLTD